MSRGKSITDVVAQIEATRKQIMERARTEVEIEWQEREAVQAVDTAERNAIVEVHRDRTAVRAAAMAKAQDAASQGEGQMAISTTTETPTNGKKLSTKQRIQNEMSEAAKRGKPTAKKVAPAKAKASAKPNGAVRSGTVHIRKRKQGDFILIHNPSVYGDKSNWASPDTFKTEEGAQAHAKKHGLKVAAK